jgi:hypothetical protein
MDVREANTMTRQAVKKFIKIGDKQITIDEEDFNKVFDPQSSDPRLSLTYTFFLKDISLIFTDLFTNFPPRKSLLQRMAVAEQAMGLSKSPSPKLKRETTLSSTDEDETVNFVNRATDSFEKTLEQFLDIAIDEFYYAVFVHTAHELAGEGFSIEGYINESQMFGRIAARIQSGMNSIFKVPAKASGKTGKWTREKRQMALFMYELALKEAKVARKIINSKESGKLQRIKSNCRNLDEEAIEALFKKIANSEIALEFAARFGLRRYGIDQSLENISRQLELARKEKRTFRGTKL